MFITPLITFLPTIVTGWKRDLDFPQQTRKQSGILPRVKSLSLEHQFHRNYSTNNIIKKIKLVTPQHTQVSPFTARVLDGVLYGDSNFWVCGRNPMMWPFKWKLSACTFTWFYLFVKILRNKIWIFGRNLPSATFGSEKVKANKLWCDHYESDIGFYGIL